MNILIGELSLPEIDKNLAAEFKKEAQRETEKASRLKQVQEHQTKYSYFDINAGNTKNVSQGELAITNSSCTDSVLATFGASPCIILCLRNPDTGDTALAHIDAMTDIQSITGPMESIKTKEGELEAHLFGGDSSSETMTKNIIEWLDHKHIPIKSAHIISDGAPSAIAIDSKTGSIMRDVKPEDFIQKNAESDLSSSTLIAEMMGESIKKRVKTCDLRHPRGDRAPNLKSDLRV